MSKGEDSWWASITSDLVKERLTPAQKYARRDGDYEIQTIQQWLEIEPRFLSEVEITGIMSVDTESLLRPEAIRSVSYTHLTLPTIYAV